MVEIFIKNHNVFPFFSFSKFFFPSCEISLEKKPMLLAIENPQNHLIIIFISRKGGSNP